MSTLPHLFNGTRPVVRGGLEAGRRTRPLARQAWALAQQVDALR